jgi:hypothetical protein
MLSIRTSVRSFRLVTNVRAMAAEIKHGAQTNFEGKDSSNDPLTSRLILEHRGLEELFQQYEHLPPGTDPKVGCSWENMNQPSPEPA